MQWEYHFADCEEHQLDRAGQELIDDYGADGWELVSVIFRDLTAFRGRGHFTFFFKRPYSEEPENNV